MNDAERKHLKATEHTLFETIVAMSDLERNYDLCKAELAGVIEDAKSQALRLNKALATLEALRKCLIDARDGGVSDGEQALAAEALAIIDGPDR